MERKSITTSRAVVVLRRLRPDAPARRARRCLHRQRLAPDGLRAVHGAGRERGLDPRGRRQRARRPRAQRAARRARSLLGRLKPQRREPAPPVELPYRRISANVARIQTGERDVVEVADDGEPELVESVGRATPAAAVAAQSGSGAEAQQASREPRHVRAVPTNADLKMARALDVFNPSAHPRRIAGVTRSLGTPMVAVSAVRGRGRDRDDRRRLGAVLVSLRGRSRRRGGRRARQRAGRRAVRAERTRTERPTPRPTNVDALSLPRERAVSRVST